MKISIIVFITILTVLTSCEKQKSTSIFIAGDSTAQTQKTEETVMRGWGQVFQSYFDSTVTVQNRAMGGRSTKTFISEERWQKILNDIQPDDYVIIQFGHNDASTRPERHASYPDYKQNLITMVNQAREKKANPILATSIVMRTFKGRALVDDRLLGYPAITRQVADSLNVPLVDAYVKTRDMIIMLGDSASKSLYMWVGPGIDKRRPDGSQDDTHLQEPGAHAVAKIIAEEIRKQNLKGIADHVVIP